jgi:hypothetical protein
MPRRNRRLPITNGKFDRGAMASLVRDLRRATGGRAGFSAGRTLGVGVARARVTETEPRSRALPCPPTLPR